jgi:hypothetical protein
MDITLGKRDLDISLIKGFIYLVVEFMDETPSVFRSMGPAQEFEF